MFCAYASRNVVVVALHMHHLCSEWAVTKKSDCLLWKDYHLENFDSEKSGSK